MICTRCKNFDMSRHVELRARRGGAPSTRLCMPRPDPVSPVPVSISALIVRDTFASARRCCVASAGSAGSAGLGQVAAGASAATAVDAAGGGRDVSAAARRRWHSALCSGQCRWLHALRSSALAQATRSAAAGGSTDTARALRLLLFAVWLGCCRCRCRCRCGTLGGASWAGQAVQGLQCGLRWRLSNDVSDVQVRGGLRRTSAVPGQRRAAPLVYC